MYKQITKFNDVIEFPFGVTKSFIDFVLCCVKKKPEKRSNVSKLLTHPFIMKGYKYDHEELFDGISEIVTDKSNIKDKNSPLKLNKNVTDDSIRKEIGILDEANVSRRSKHKSFIKSLRIQDYQVIGKCEFSSPESDKFISQQKTFTSKNDSQCINSSKNRDKSFKRYQIDRSKDTKKDSKAIQRRLKSQRKTSFINFDSESIFN